MSGSTADDSLAPMEEFVNRVNVMRTNLPYCVVSTSADPEISRPGVLVLASRVPSKLPDRRATYSAFASAVSQVGRGGLKVEEVVATGPWAAWAASTWGQKDPEAYSGKLVRHSVDAAEASYPADIHCNLC